MSENVIVLEVKQDLDNDGWEDDNGTVHYDDTIQSPWGPVEQLETTFNEGGELVITNAPRVILVSNKPIDEWPQQSDGVTVVKNEAFGLKLLKVEAVNGNVVYQYIPGLLAWSDEPGELISDYSLGIRTSLEWAAGEEG